MGDPLPPREVLKEVQGITAALVAAGLVDDQTFGYLEERDGFEYVRFACDLPFSTLLKPRSYRELYWELRDARAFNFLMLDGALVQMLYEFDQGSLRRHRLAFLPSPDLGEFQNFPELYLEEVLYADVVDIRVVAVPMRFDYDARDEVVGDAHPACHLTLGQYEHCRIPVSSGVTPTHFVDFVLRNFYWTAHIHVGVSLPPHRGRFEPCMTDAHRKLLHIGVPE